MSGVGSCLGVAARARYSCITWHMAGLEPAIIRRAVFAYALIILQLRNKNKKIRL